MKSRYSKVFVFAGKSFLWAAALYSVCLLALYKDDIASAVATSQAFSVNMKVHALPRVDTTIVPNIPHTGIFLSSHMGLRSVEVSIDGLLRIVNLFRK
ncbi:MAG: hypothetical protein P4L41_15340 [Flavipsychrobacter sp.]|nr:hypothetical protein [Flavipsychrobacter sp.]